VHIIEVEEASVSEHDYEQEQKHEPEKASTPFVLIARNIRIDLFGPRVDAARDIRDSWKAS
jgi:hypothetical protein